MDFVSNHSDWQGVYCLCSGIHNFEAISKLGETAY